MSTLQDRTTAILTEHFGYPPLAVIDDIINAVNHILYKCTQAMETYLTERQHERINDLKGKDSDMMINNTQETDLWLKLPKDEISMGTAKLETLLESQVDQNFDKFELYALRNIFTIPSELVEEGWIKLKHHEGIDYSKYNDKSNDDSELKRLIKDIELELKLRKILKLQIEKGTRIVTILNQYKTSLEFLSSNDKGKLSPEVKKSIRDLLPIEDNLFFLLNQIDHLINQVNKLHTKFETKGFKTIKFKPSLRDYYIQGKSFKLLENIGILEQDDYGENLNENLMIPHSDISTQDISNLKSVNQ